MREYEILNRRGTRRPPITLRGINAMKRRYYGITVIVYLLARVAAAQSLPRNPTTAALNASGWSTFEAWPASAITAFRAPGIFAAM